MVIPIGGFDGNQGTFTPTLTNTFTNTNAEIIHKLVHL